VKVLADIVRKNSSALVVVDAISGLAAQPLETDAWGLDVVVSASQKGLMNAPGLAFFALSEKGLKAVDAGKLPRFYWDLRAYKKSLPNGETPYTPSVSLVVAQKAALDLILKDGIEAVWKRTRELGEHCRRELQRLGLTIFSKVPCDGLTAANLPEGLDGQALIERILEKKRISIAGGQEKLKGRIVRVAHMGAISRTDLEAGLEALREELAQIAVR
jgi:aspartate aminotransferase-like enzyme